MFGSTFLSAAAALFFLAPTSFAAPLAVPSISAVSQITSITTVFRTYNDKLVVVQNAVEGLNIKSQEPDVIGIYYDHLLTVQTDLSALLTDVQNLNIKLSVGGAGNMNPAVVVELKNLAVVVASLLCTVFSILLPVLTHVITSLPEVVTGLVSDILGVLVTVLALVFKLVPGLLVIVLTLLGNLEALILATLGPILQTVTVSW